MRHLLGRTVALAGVLLAAAPWPGLSAAPPTAGPAGVVAPLIHYRFAPGASEQTVPNAARPEYPARLVGGARVAPVPGSARAALSLDGQAGYLQVEGSEGLHIGPEGFSIVATVRFADAGMKDGQPDAHDMIVFKDGEYLLGRLCDKLYVNLHDGHGWNHHILVGPLPLGSWCHVAVTIGRNSDPAQGVNGCTIRIFLNGVLAKTIEKHNLSVPATPNPVTIGKGWGGPWFFRGEIAELAVHGRAIGDAELNRLLRQETLAPVTVKRIADPDPRYGPRLAEAEAAVATARPPGAGGLRRFLAAVVQAEHVADRQADLLPALDTILEAEQAPPADPLARFAAAHPEFQFLDNGRIGIAFYTSASRGVALCSLFDLTEGRELLGEQRVLWALEYALPGGGETRTLDSAAESLTATLTLDRSAGTAALEWTHASTAAHPIEVVVRSVLRLTGPRLALSLEVENHSPSVALRQVQFPMVRLRRLDSGTDRLLVPFMSGVVHERPVTGQFSYQGQYPSGNAHMQFLAYYDDRQGIYLACEDPLARGKHLLTQAADHDCAVSFRWFAGCPGDGGNGFRISGEAAIELFRGDWFDAAQIYKRFVPMAAWWPASRLREDTPEWYHSLSVWFQGSVNTDQDVEELLAMQRYLDLPVGVHAYNWSTAPWPPFTGHPHFLPPKEGFEQRVARLQAGSVHVKPYINARLWDTHDRDKVAKDPESADYVTLARPHAVKRLDQSVATEDYSGRPFAVMCPATAFWQGAVRDLTSAVAEYGVRGIYFDQVAAGAPAVCFDRTHPHAAGSGDTWLEQGYWPMLAAIRNQLKPRYPDLAFDSEDAAEPYMHLLDGYLPWRFVDIGHVPAFQSIYAGRVQLTGRVNTGDPQAKFAVAAEQLLYGEQIGWFGVSTLSGSPHLRLFVKKLAHARQAFLPFFNAGDMLKPARWAGQMPVITADWGYYGPRLISTPALQHSAWRLGDAIAVLFVNTSYAEVTGELLPPVEAWQLPATVQVAEIQEGTAPVTAAWRPSAPRRISVPGYSVAAWIIDPQDHSTVRARLGAVLARARSRSPGNRDVAGRVGRLAARFTSIGAFEGQDGISRDAKREQGVAMDPWLQPDLPVRPATDWHAAAEARLVNGALTDGSLLATKSAQPRAAFGRLDFGEATQGPAFIEYEVAAGPDVQGGNLLLFAADPASPPGQGVLIAKAGLSSTDGVERYATVRTPLIARPAGVQNVTLFISLNYNSGPCALRRWRLVTETPRE